MGLVDGVVTEDSDVFLFGAKRVYRSIFADKKFLESYHMDDLSTKMGLDREDLIAFAYFLGSDYTPGIRGIGIVNALEIIRTFDMKSVDGGPLGGLLRFKSWLEHFDINENLNKSKKSISLSDPRVSEFNESHKALRSHWALPGNFPDPRVAEAYLKPKSDETYGRFPRPNPQVERLRCYCCENLGWTQQQVKTVIEPVVSAFHSGTCQPSIEKYLLRLEDDIRFAKVASARLEKSINNLSTSRTRVLTKSADS